MGSFFEDKVKTPIVQLLKSGAAPESIALAMAFGISGGIFPIPGLTSVPVMVAIFIFKLNPVAAMLTNYLCTPINIATVPLFIYYGNNFFGHESDRNDFSMSKFMSDMKTDTITTLLQLRYTLMNAIYMWIIIMPILTILCYGVLTPIFKQVMKKTRKD